MLMCHQIWNEDKDIENLGIVVCKTFVLVVKNICGGPVDLSEATCALYMLSYLKNTLGKSQFFIKLYR